MYQSGGNLVTVCAVLFAVIVQVRGGMMQSNLQQIFSTIAMQGSASKSRSTSEEHRCENSPCDENAVWNDCDNICECKKDYYGNGFVCYKNPCENNPCDENAACRGDDDNICKCDPDYYGNGFVCYMTPCYSNPCMNGGLCRQSEKINQSVICDCPAGFIGDSCELTVVPCRYTKKVSAEQTCSREECGANSGKGTETNQEVFCVINKEGDHDSWEVPPDDGCQDISKSSIDEYQSYMHFPRVHFAGLFQADVPTVNNRLENFNIHNFSPYNTKQGGQGGWNPMGSGNFRMLDSRVTRVCDTEGNCVVDPSTDPMVGAEVKDGDFKAPAKLADIDVEVEGYATEIWGLVVHIDGFFKGNFQETSCRYIWNKRKGVIGTQGEGTKYQSVLTDVVFGPKFNTSLVAKTLKCLLGKKRELSISFNLDLFNKTIGTFNFTYGRLVGSIGLSGSKSPPYFTKGRLLKPVIGVEDASFAPVVFDQQNSRLFMDLGNSLAINDDGNVLDSVNYPLAVGYVDSDKKEDLTCSSQITWIGNITDKDNGGYSNTSGISVINNVDDDVSNQRLILAKRDSGDKCIEVLLAEDFEGYDIQPFSRWAFRMQYGDTKELITWITKFGELLPDDDSTTGDVMDSKYIFNVSKTPKLVYDGKKTAHVFSITVNATEDPKNIRKYKDGQVYALQYFIKENPCTGVDRMTAFNTAILVLVWNNFTVPQIPTWIPHIQPIFQQYANLFPVMKMNFMDLGNYFDVKKHRERIRKTMSLPLSDPNFMPVTRDLSPKKKDMIVKWLESDDLPYIEKESKAKKPIDLDTLKNLLQIALQLEHATIPPYLSGYLSIKHGQNQKVKEILRGILIDEMYHLAQVSNILNAVGGNPDLLRSDFILPYPSYLPGGAHPHALITVDKISLHQIQEVYMQIEEPFHELEEHAITKLIDKMLLRSDPRGKACEEQKKELFIGFEDAVSNHNTIGELYQAIIWLIYDLTKCGGNKTFFTVGKTKQFTNGNEGLKQVTNMTSALDGIHFITRQGEGASPCNPLQGGDQAENSEEMSHYYAFASIIHNRFVKKVKENKVDNPSQTSVKCDGNFGYFGRELPFTEDGVWPVVKDPKMSKYKIGSRAYKLSKQFNEVYSRLMHSLQNVFNGNVDRFEDSMGLMKTLMVIGDQLVQTPIEEGGDPDIGPNAGPTYRNDN